MTVAQVRSKRKRWALIRSALWGLSRALLSPFGYAVYFKDDVTQLQHRWDRSSMSGVLDQLVALGLKPATVIDVGAALGTEELYQAFPEAKHLLIEPLEEYEDQLLPLLEQYRSITLVKAAATGRSGKVVINVHPELDGSSLYQEEEGAEVDGTPREVPSITLDGICTEHGLGGPYLLKIDVEGAELEVMNGAERILQETACVILEAALFRFRRGAPLIDEVVLYMKERGFAIYDVTDSQYRPLDGAMSQVDLTFVRRDGELRKDQTYATREQRAARGDRYHWMTQSETNDEQAR